VDDLDRFHVQPFLARAQQSPEQRTRSRPRSSDIFRGSRAHVAIV
jgi:hypothetical protein